MASPQLENGFTRIANEILDALAKNGLPRNEMQLIMVIFRHTYGYGQPSSFIKHKIFKDKTLMTKYAISKAKRNLQDRNIITVTENGNGLGSIYRFNKNYNTWKPLPKKATPPKPLPKKATPVTEKGNETPFAPIICKENIKYISAEFKFKAKQPYPKTFHITDRLKKYCLKLRYNQDLKTELDRFEAYHKAKGSKFNDWEAAFRTWIQNDIKWHPEHQDKEMEEI